MLLQHDISNPQIAIGCLLRLYRHQTLDERARQGTIHQNGVGFNALDADILSSFARQYIAKGYLSDKQLALLRAKLPTYHGQLNGCEITPVEIKSASPRPEAGSGKRCELTKAYRGIPQVLVYFAYDKGIVEQLKALQGRRWAPELPDKPWQVSATPDNLAALKRLGFPIPSEIAPKTAEDALGLTISPRPSLPTLDGRLYPFQSVGVKQIDAWGGRALLADEMGLGKTAQAIQYIAVRREECLPALVICPATLKLNWEKEVKMWAPDLTCAVLSGRTAEELPQVTITIINYDVLADRFKTVKEDYQLSGNEEWAGEWIYNQDTKTQTRRVKNPGWQGTLMQRGFKIIVLDEAHYCRARDAARTKSVTEITKGRRVLAMSGTPIVNRPVEFFPALNMVRPDVFGSFWAFAKKYCDAKQNRWGWDFSGSSNIEELHKLLIDTCMIRRLKKDVLADLPEKRRQALSLELDPDAMRKYRRAESDIIGYVREIAGDKAATKARRAEILVQFEKCKQLAAEAKMPAAIEWIKDTLENDGKLVLMTTHTATLDRLMEELKDFNPVRLDGSTSQTARQAAVDRFQTDASCRVFIGNIKAAGVGITLTAASTVIFLELAWTPGDHDQAEDRIHRIGQKDAALAVYLLAAGTIDETIARLLDSKREVLAAALDGVEVDADSLLADLLAEYLER